MMKDSTRCVSRCDNQTARRRLYSIVHDASRVVIFKRVCAFTLIELIVSMAIFSIMLLILVSFFNDAQRAWTGSAARAEVYENARIALDLITRDLQCAYYSEDETPFWHVDGRAAGFSNEFQNELLAFVAVVDPPSAATTKICEVKYQLYYTATPTDANAGWLRRSVTGNDIAKWNYTSNFTVDETGAGKAFSANDDSSDTLRKVIPRVVNIEFHCFDQDGAMDEDEIEDGSNFTVNIDDSGLVPTKFPYSIMVKLTLLDKAAWKKWIALGGEPHNIYYDYASDTIVDNESVVAAKEYRKKHERVFSKTIYLGGRGQN